LKPPKKYSRTAARGHVSRNSEIEPQISNWDETVSRGTKIPQKSLRFKNEQSAKAGPRRSSSKRGKNSEVRNGLKQSNGSVESPK
jgi:hypothetical protein